MNSVLRGFLWILQRAHKGLGAIARPEAECLLGVAM
jgi:hypothetical protein